MARKQITDFGTASIRSTVGVNLSAVDQDASEPADSEPAEGVFVAVKLKTKNPTNNREQYWAVAKRAKAEHEAVAAALFPHFAKRSALANGCVVTLTRLSAGELDDDGLRAAMKSVRDAVAIWLWGGKKGQRDNDARGRWRYEQLKCDRGEFGITISIQPRREEDDPQVVQNRLRAENEALRKRVAELEANQGA